MFRVEHVGSFLRPERLLDAARARKAGRISQDQFKTIQDDCIRDIVAFQESIGLPTMSLRRPSGRSNHDTGRRRCQISEPTHRFAYGCDKGP